MSLFAAVQMRDARLAKGLLAAGRERYAASPRKPIEPKEIEAFLDEDLAKIEAALSSGSDPNSAIFPDPEHHNLLSVSLARHHAHGACLLIEYGACVRRCLANSRGWRMPVLHLAASEGLSDIVWLSLLDGADPNELGEGRSALFLAASLESPEIAEMLIAAGANVNLGLAMETPLMAAAEHGRAATVDLLLSHHADIQAKSQSGWTALHHAAWSDHVPIARKLLDAGADPLAVDLQGRNATDHATQKFDPIYAEIFRQWGIPDKYSPEAINDAWQPTSDFDYFISYRHGKYTEQALNLAAELRAESITPFLDRELLDLTTPARLSTALIKSRLMKALQRSRTTIFFETYRAESDDPNFSWQFFELLNSREALLVSLEDGSAKRWITIPGNRASTSSTLFLFSGIQELAAALATRSWIPKEATEPG